MDSELNQLLRSLPRAKASESFTRSVLSRAEKPVAGSWFRFALVPATIALAMFMVAGQQFLAERAESQRMLILRAEQQRLAFELEELKNEAQVDGLIYLGSSGSTHFAVDLAGRTEGAVALPSSTDTMSTTF